MSAGEETYGHRLWQRFTRDFSARVGLGLILILFIVSALAPFLAGNHALVRVAEGRTTFPVFASMDRVEWRFAIYLPLAALVYLLRGTMLRRPAIFLLPVLVLMIEIGLSFVHPINDTTNDRERPASFKLMPLVPFSPVESSPDAFVSPNWKHWCGTDATGRDIASRMLHGGRVSLSIGVVSQSVALLVGVSVGGIAGYYRRWVDITISRFIEVIECFPTLLLILVVLSLRSDATNNMFLIMIVIGLTSWTGMARLVRGEFLRPGDQQFVHAARAVGAGDGRIIARHLLPNALGPILVSATFGVASAILIESSLSFLGFGMQAPTPSWGGILSDARQYLDYAWWLAFFPGLVILITVTSYNFVGEGLRDAVDSRLRIK